ncbi:universal stress protein [Polynucleobacter sp. MWH-UH23A]|uniref:universal stress protein n=1 Tax=Polynucleobacter sp. MWH-UH23A TaxID=1855613 RepID=UPI00336507B6
MYKKILVAVDGSDTSKLALKEAMNLAGDCGSILRIVYVVDIYNMYAEAEYMNYKEVQKSLEREGEMVLERAKRSLKQSGISFSQHLIKTSSRKPRVAETIVADADKWKADLIVVGTHGRRGFSRFLLGSVAESIARVATKPVLLIRGKGN